MGKYVATDTETQKKAVKQNIVAITTALLEQTYENDPFFGDLGRGLLVLDNSVEADHAFQLDVTPRTDADILTYNIPCDSCSKTTDSVGGLFICVECAEHWSCVACMTAYDSTGSKDRACVGHRFHKVEGRY